MYIIICVYITTYIHICTYQIYIYTHYICTMYNLYYNIYIYIKTTYYICYIVYYYIYIEKKKKTIYIMEINKIIKHNIISICININYNIYMLYIIQHISYT